jgi:hypothetical protein
MNQYARIYIECAAPLQAFKFHMYVHYEKVMGVSDLKIVVGRDLQHSTLLVQLSQLKGRKIARKALDARGEARPK